MSRVLAAFAGLRGIGSSIAPYVLLAVIMPGGFAVAPLLYWHRRRRSEV